MYAKCHNSTTKVGMLVKFGQKNPLPVCNTLLWSQRSRKVQPEVNSRMSYDYQIWSEEPLTRVKYIRVVKGHAKVNKKSALAQLSRLSRSCWCTANKSVWIPDVGIPQFDYGDIFLTFFLFCFWGDGMFSIHLVGSIPLQSWRRSLFSLSCKTLDNNVSCTVLRTLCPINSYFTCLSISQYVLNGKGDFIIGMFFLSECSTPFLSFRFIMKKVCLTTLLLQQFT